MQTWLSAYAPGDPTATYRESARVLSTGHLQAQANEALTVLRQCSGVPIPWTGPGWRNVALTRAWRPYARHLAAYGYAVCLEQQARGWKVPHLDLFDTLRRVIRDTGAPHWLGGPVHARCRANLLAKTPEHYDQYGWTETPALGQIWGDIAEETAAA